MLDHVSIASSSTTRAISPYSEYRIETYASGKEIKWSLFTAGKRGSIGKIIVQLIPCCEEHFNLHNETVQKAASVVTECKEDTGECRNSDMDVSATMCVDMGERSGTGSSCCNREPYIFVENVFIDKKFRGKSLSNYMLEYCKRYFVSANKNDWYYRYIELEAEEDMDQYGKLVDLYLRNGYQELHGPGCKEFKVLYNGEQTFRVVPMRNLLFKPRPVSFLLPFGEKKVDAREWERMKSLQTFGFVQSMKEETMKRCRLKMTMGQALVYLSELYPGSLHRATGMASEIEANGHPEWLQFVGLILDVGVIQNQLLWGAPFPHTGQMQGQMQGQMGLLPPWAHADACSSWGIKDSAGLQADLLPWSCYEYLYTTLTRCKNRRKHSIPVEGLETLRYYNVNVSDFCGESILYDTLDVQFWLDILRDCQKSVENKLRTNQLSFSKLEPRHMKLLDTYCQEVIEW